MAPLITSNPNAEICPPCRTSIAHGSNDRPHISASVQYRSGSAEHFHTSDSAATNIVSETTTHAAYDTEYGSAASGRITSAKNGAFAYGSIASGGSPGRLR